MYVLDELYNKKPGRSLVKLLTFTGAGKDAIDKRGWTYVHMDEALEMLAVRHLKSLSTNFLGHLENASSWLQQVSMFRALSRYFTGASRSFGRKRVLEDGGEREGPLAQYDRNAIQWRTVSRMVHVMREKGFLNVSHKGSEWLTNVFSCLPRRMNIAEDQKRLLQVSELGKTTTKLHSSVLFPDVFGTLSEEDIANYFGGKRFKKWTRLRAVTRASKSMSKNDGAVSILSPEDAIAIDENFTAGSVRTRRPAGNHPFTSVMVERRRKITRAKDLLYKEERRAIRSDNKGYLKEVMSRWDSVHERRYLMSPFADCFLNLNCQLNHPQKSKYLKYTRRQSRDVL